MSITVELPTGLAQVANPEEGRLLALVQGDLVISIFPEHQRDAAIDLARVLCRALGQPVGIYQRRRDGKRVEAGAASGALLSGEWALIVRVTTSLLARVNVEVLDQELVSTSLNS